MDIKIIAIVRILKYRVTTIMSFACTLHAMASSSTQIIGAGQHAKVVLALRRVRHRWFHIFLHLGVPVEELKAIRTKFSNDADDCLVEAIDYFLKQDEQTWEKLARAVALTVGGRDIPLARQIAREHGFSLGEPATDPERLDYSFYKQ